MEGFAREGLDERKDEVMLEAIAAASGDETENPFAALLERSAENQRRILESLENLADVLASTSDCVAGPAKVVEAMTRAEELRSDLDARTQYLNVISQAPLSVSMFSAPMDKA